MPWRFFNNTPKAGWLMNNTETGTHKDMLESDKAILPVKSLLLVLVLQLISHQSHSPLWLSIFVLLIGVFKYVAYKNNVVKIPWLLRVVLMLGSLGVFFLYYRANFTVDMAASFLFLASVLKLLEINQPKDAVVYVFSMLYLSAVSFLFDQGILHTVLQLVLVSCCLYSLFIMQLPTRQLTVSTRFLIGMHGKSMLKMLVFAIPFVVVLFLFFPRIAPLWQMPIKTQSAKTGMSAEMSPGDVSKLAKSSATAFRAVFDESPPDRSSLYWRGLILDQFDGRRWDSAGAQSRWSRPVKVDPGRLLTTSHPAYQVMLVPHQQRWVFALDGSTPASSNLLPSDMGLYRLKTDAIQPTRYQMELPEASKGRVFSRLPTAVLMSGVDRSNSTLKQDLQVPSAQVNPRSQAYIRQLRQSFSDDMGLIEHLMRQFAEQDFFYTLEPPLVGDHFVDEFFFDSKQGFCEHYASSLAYLLRLAGIPARVVLGYQGGELNEQSNYMIVAQYDAHAWVEAFIETIGWLRLDPTAMVAPQRIRLGSQLSLAEEASFMEDNPFASAAMRSNMINWLRLRIDKLNFQWQNLVVNYNQDNQGDFIRKVFGASSLLRIGLFFVYLLIMVFVSMLVYLWYQRFSGYSRAERHYLFWLLFLNRVGLFRQKGESPRVFLKRVEASKYKRLAKITEKFTRKLEAQQYRDTA